MKEGHRTEVLEVVWSPLFGRGEVQTCRAAACPVRRVQPQLVSWGEGQVNQGGKFDRARVQDGQRTIEARTAGVPRWKGKVLDVFQPPPSAMRSKAADAGPPRCSVGVGVLMFEVENTFRVLAHRGAERIHGQLVQQNFVFDLSASCSMANSASKPLFWNCPP